MTFWDSVMKEIFPWIFAAALLLAGSAFLYAGVKLTSTPGPGARRSSRNSE